MFPDSKSILWLYLGQDFFKRRFMEQELGNRFERINIAKIHEEVAADIRHEYVTWIDELNRLYGKKIEWWFGNISSRNVYNSNIFQYICYIEILEKLLSENERRPELIVTESLGLARAIQKWAYKKNIAVDVLNYDQAKQKSLINQLFFFLSWGNFTAILALRCLAAYISGKKTAKKQIKIDPGIIVNTFIHDYCLSEDGTFKDRYFPYLHEYLSGKGLYILIHPVLVGFQYNYFQIYRKMRRSRSNFIIQEDYLHLSDYLSAVKYPIYNLQHKIKAPPFHNLDLYDILKEEQREQSITSSMEAVLIYRLFLRLGKHGLRPGQVIDWYENQIIDKALIAGTRNAFPQTKVIGAQMFIHSPNFVSLFPSQSESEAKIVPHILLETSQYQCKIAQTFTKTIPCQSAAALRYAHLFDDENTPDRRIEQDSKTILVLLPFSIAEALELLDILRQGLDKIRNEVHIFIKGHPDYTPEELVKSFGVNVWPNRFEIFQGNMPQALNSASLIISSNSSSMVEAAARGIPVIFLGRQTTLNQNILSGLNLDIMTECFCISEVIESIEKYLNLTRAEKIRYKEIGKKVRDLFFEPVNEDTLLPFLYKEGTYNCQ